MNIQVNLIRLSEQRSASLVSLKSMGLIAAIVVPLIAVLGLGWIYMGFLEARGALKLLEQEQEQTAQARREALALGETLRVQREILDEVLGWHRSRVPWHEVLDGILPHVPATMQWRSLQMLQETAVAKDGQLERAHAVALIGRCQGPGAEQQVEALRRAWVSEPPMGPWVEQATVAAFAEDEAPDAAREDRQFQIDVKFRPGRFHAPAGK